MGCTSIIWWTDTSAKLTMQTLLRVLAICAIMASASGLELTKTDFDSKTAGKTVFIKFLAPW